MRSKNQGVTLIALIVTMVVLLIIASISLTIVLSDGGLIERVKTAKTKENYNIAFEEVNDIILQMQNESEFPITIEEIKARFNGNYVKNIQNIYRNSIKKVITK